MYNVDIKLSKEHRKMLVCALPPFELGTILPAGSVTSYIRETTGRKDFCAVVRGKCKAVKILSIKFTFHVRFE
jgi:hypothetical protein